MTHLNNLNMLEPFFGRVPREYANNCAEIVEANKEAFDHDIMARLKAEDDQNCILENFNNFKIHNLYLKGKMYFDFRKTSIKNFTKEASETTSDVLKTIQKICTAAEKFGEEFDKSIEESKKLKEKATNQPIQECLKKYFFEKNILSAEEFKVNVTAINAEDCDEVIEELDSPPTFDTDPTSLFYALPSNKVQKCINNNIEGDNILLKLTSFGVALYMDLDDELTDKLRERYIDINTTNLRFLLKCLEEILIIK